MSDCLNGVGVEYNAPFARPGTDLGRKQYSADLIVRGHYRNEGGIAPDSAAKLVNRDLSEFVYAQTGHLKARLFYAPECIEHGVVFY